MVVCNLTELMGKDVYTRNAKYVGKIDDTMLDTEKGNLYGVAVSLTKESFLSKTVGPDAAARKTILIPYREILACEDIVIVTVPKQYERPADEKAEPNDMDEVLLPGADSEA